MSEPYIIKCDSTNDRFYFIPQSLLNDFVDSVEKLINAAEYASYAAYVHIWNEFDRKFEIYEIRNMKGFLEDKKILL